jgi:hypothetical protein
MPFGADISLPHLESQISPVAFDVKRLIHAQVTTNEKAQPRLARPIFVAIEGTSFFSELMSIFLCQQECN